MLAAGCAVVAVALAWRAFSPDTASERVASVESGASNDARWPDERSASGEPWSRRGAGPSNGVKPGERRAAGTNADAKQWSGRGAPAIAGAAKGTTRSGTGHGGDAAGEATGQVPRRYGGDDQLQPRLTHDELPVGPGTGQDADEPVVDEIPEVPYEGGETVFNTGSRVEITEAGPITGDAGTISFWLEPQWDQGELADGTFVQLGDSGLQIVKSGNNLRFELVGSGGEEFGGGVDISAWQAGDWRNVTATWNGNTLSLYVDGAQMFLNTPPRGPNFQTGTQLYVGSQPPSNGAAARAQLSYLTVMNRVATFDEVHQIYESGGRTAGAQ